MYLVVIILHSVLVYVGNKLKVFKKKKNTTNSLCGNEVPKINLSDARTTAKLVSRIIFIHRGITVLVVSES